MRKRRETGISSSPPLRLRLVGQSPTYVEEKENGGGTLPTPPDLLRRSINCQIRYRDGKLPVLDFWDMNFIGMDLTTSPKKKTACAFLDADLRLRDRVLLGSDEDIVAFIEVHRPALVAIDAPLSLPLGLCCLEETCSCQPVSPRKGRQCERELSALGIGCYYTTKRSIIKGMVYRGIRLKADLEGRGHTVIEIYPYASKVRLFGPLPRKTTVAGRRALQKGLQRLIPSVLSPQRDLLSHDTLDALLAAYTGFLCDFGRTEALGDPSEGLLHIPIRRK